MKQTATVLMVALLLSGCGHFRYLATSETQPSVGVQTKNRYRLFQFCVKQNGKYVNLNKQAFASAWATFKSTVPNVFAEDGKPVAVYLDYTGDRQTKYGWTLLFPYLLTLGVFPMWDHHEWRSHYSIRFKKPKKVEGGLRNSYSVKMERDWNMNIYGPIALCFPYGTPVPDGSGRPFYRKQTHVLGSTDTQANAVVINSAIAYGAACTLKQLEDDGALPDIWGDESVAPTIGVERNMPPVESKAGDGGSGVVEIDSIPL